MSTETTVANQLRSLNLSVGDEVWGYTAMPCKILNKEFQEVTSIRRTGDRRYEISCGWRADGTGWREYCGSFQKAISISKFPPSSIVVDGKIQTPFDI